MEEDLYKAAMTREARLKLDPASQALREPTGSRTELASKRWKRESAALALETNKKTLKTDLVKDTARAVGDSVKNTVTACDSIARSASISPTPGISRSSGAPRSAAAARN